MVPSANLNGESTFRGIVTAIKVRLWTSRLQRWLKQKREYTDYCGIESCRLFQEAIQQGHVIVVPKLCWISFHGGNFVLQGTNILGVLAQVV